MTAPSRAEVIIAGASFAGLAVAREVGGRALLVDPVPVGEGQTSACGAPVSVLEALGALGSIQQRHDALILHLPGREVTWPLPEPFCTFDYRRCCLDALAGAAAGVIRASVRGHRGPIVMTSVGEIAGRILVDCTGWRAALADADRRDPRTHYFGLEAEVASGLDRQPL